MFPTLSKSCDECNRDFQPVERHRRAYRLARWRIDAEPVHGNGRKIRAIKNDFMEMDPDEQPCSPLSARTTIVII